MRRGQGSWAVALAGLALLAARPARAWDPATTHGGLTERAVSASRLHAVLAAQLGRPLGAFEPLRLEAGKLAPEVARSLTQRLAALDPAGGYPTSLAGSALAAAWVKAGAVLEKTPPERGRHHFLDPRQGSGLDDAAGLAGAWHAARLTLDGGETVRQAATGSGFALEGMSALDWLRSPQNDLGLTAFHEHFVGAVRAPQAAERDAELVRALLALGGILAVLEDMGQPAFVRNDLRGDLLADDAGSAYERFVADRYGAVALPPPAAPVARPNVDSYFVAPDGQGLAQRTQAGFFSAGTVPGTVRVVRGEAPAELTRLVNQRLSFPSPEVGALDPSPGPGPRYLVRDGVRILAYERAGDQLRFFLDRAVYADCARHWLPVIEGYATGLVDHLLRARLSVALEGGKLSVALQGTAGRIEPGSVIHVLAEDGKGARREIARAQARSEGTLSFAVPAETKKLAAYLHGRDAAGPVVAAAELAVP